MEADAVAARPTSGRCRSFGCPASFGLPASGPMSNRNMFEALPLCPSASVHHRARQLRWCRQHCCGNPRQSARRMGIRMHYTGGTGWRLTTNFSDHRISDPRFGCRIGGSCSRNASPRSENENGPTDSNRCRRHYPPYPSRVAGMVGLGTTTCPRISSTAAGNTVRPHASLCTPTRTVIGPRLHAQRVSRPASVIAAISSPTGK